MTRDTLIKLAFMCKEALDEKDYNVDFFKTLKGKDPQLDDYVNEIVAQERLYGPDIESQNAAMFKDHKDYYNKVQHLKKHQDPYKYITDRTLERFPYSAMKIRGWV